MPLCQPEQCLFKDVALQFAANAYRPVDEISGTFRCNLMVEPYPLLRIRQWKIVSGLGMPHQISIRTGTGLLPDVIQTGSQGSNSRLLKYRTGFQLNCATLTYKRKQMHGINRIAAERKETGAAVSYRHPQDFLKQGSNLLFGI